MRDATINDTPQVRHAALPGGGHVIETWHSPAFVTVELSGEIDVFDERSLVDLSTGWVLEGARYVSIDAAALQFVDLVVLEALDRARRHLSRTGGVLDVHGLRPAFARVWCLVVGRHGADRGDGCTADLSREPALQRGPSTPHPATPPPIAA